MDASLRVSGVWTGYRKGAGTIDAVADGRARRRRDPVGLGAGRPSGGVPAGGAHRAPRSPRRPHGGRRSFRGRRLRRRGGASPDARARGKRKDDRSARPHDRRRRLARVVLPGAPGRRVRRAIPGNAWTSERSSGSSKSVPWRRGKDHGRRPGDDPGGEDGPTDCRGRADGARTSRCRRRRDPSPSNASRRARPGAASTWRRRRSSSTNSGSRSPEAPRSGRRRSPSTWTSAPGTSRGRGSRRCSGRLEEAGRPRSRRRADSKRSRRSLRRPVFPPTLSRSAATSVFRSTLSPMGTFLFKPVLADVRLEDGTVASARVRKADLCGIATTGEARFLPGGARRPRRPGGRRGAGHQRPAHVSGPRERPDDRRL